MYLTRFQNFCDIGVVRKYLKELIDFSQNLLASLIEMDLLKADSKSKYYLALLRNCKT